MGKKSNYTPNDHRSIIKNPNNPAHKDAQDNRSKQLNPQDPKHQPKQEAPPGPDTKS